MLRASRVLGILVVFLGAGCGQEPAPAGQAGESSAGLSAGLEAALAAPGLRLDAEPVKGRPAFKAEGDAFVHGARGATAPAGGREPAFEARIERDGTISVRAHDTMGGIKLRPLRGPLQTGAPSLRGDRVVFDAGDAAVVYRAKANALKEDIVLARSRGDALDFEWELLLDEGLEATIDAHGNVNVYGPGNYLWGDVQFGDDATRQAVERARAAARKDQLLYRIPVPVIRDATGTAGAQGRFELRDHTLALHVTRLARLVYPVSIDPTVTVTSATDFGLGGNLESNAQINVANGEVARSKTRLGGATWTGTTAFTAGRYGHSVVAYNGFLYVMGGYTSTGATNAVSYAPINTDGTVGAWTATTPLPLSVYQHASVAYNGTMYLIGGVAGGYRTDVYKTTINLDGTLGTSWTTESSLPRATAYHAAVGYGGYLYVTGGYNTTDGQIAVVLYAAVHGDGTLGSWLATSPLSEGRYRHGMVAYQGWLYVVGGSTASTTYSNSVVRGRINNSGTVVSWTALPLLPTGRWGHSVVASSGHLYCIGGYGTGGYINEVRAARFDAIGSYDEWVLVSSDANMTRRYVGAAAWGNYLYVAGGYTGSVYDNQVFYSALDENGSLTGQAWAGNTGTFGSRYGHTTVAHNGFLYVLGGYNGTTYLNTVYSAPIDAIGTVGAWTQRASFTNGRMRHGTVVANGFLYILGGQLSPTSYASDVQKAYLNSDGALGSWSATTAFTTGRRQFGAVAARGYMYVIGGMDVGGNILADVQYALVNDDGTLGSWATTATLGNGRYSHDATVYNNRIYVVGGVDSVSGRVGTILYSSVGSAGALGTWSTAANALPVTRNLHRALAHNGYLYVLGGYAGGTTADVAYAPIAYTGNLGAFSSTSTMPGIRQELGAAIHDGRIYVTGGFDTQAEAQVWWARVNSTGTLGGATTTTAFSTPRQGASMVAANGYLYLLGGYDGTIWRSDVLRSAIDPNTGTLSSWGQLSTTIPVARTSFGAVVLNGYLYVIGGATGIGAYTPTVYYAAMNADGTLGSFTATAGLPSARCLLTATTAFGKYIHVVGGYSVSAGGFTDVLYAAPAADGSIPVWNTTTALPSSLRSHGAFTNGNYLYVVGGTGASGAYISDVLVGGINSADGTISSWSSQTPLPTTIVYQGLVGADGFLYAIGGYGPVSTIWSAPIAYAGGLGNWTNTSELNVARYMPAAAAANGRIYVAGGSGTSGFLGSVESFVPHTPAAYGEYSKLIDFGAPMKWDNFYWSGYAYAYGRVGLEYRAAQESGIFAGLMDLGDVPKTTYVTVPSQDARYLWLRLTLDDTRYVMNTYDLTYERDVDYFYVNYTNRCAGIVCSALDQCHDVGVCDPYTGICSNPARGNGTTCNDGNACTQTDTCQSGTCTGTNPVVCTALGQCYDVGVCDTGTGVCSNPFKPTSASCDDGRSCTTGDHCDGAGACIAGVSNCNCTSNTDCVPPNDCTNQGTCNVGTGQCSYTSFKASGTDCSDGSLCTTSDKCDGAGSCVGTAVVCTALDQCHTAGTCNPATGQCTNPAKADGTACNDSNACTQTDTCQGGSCTGANPKVCTALDQCHTAGTCDPGTGVCSNPPKSDGSACSDGNACTQTDTCQSGACVGGNPVVCVALDQCHVAGTCNTGTGICTDPIKSNGTACDDGNLCTQTDQCQNGTCAGSNPKTCTASDQCHDAGSCDPASGLCSNPPKTDGTTCDDSSKCTTGEHCVAGVCGSPTTTVTCSALDQCHDVGTCDPGTGVCSNPVKTNGTGCDDGKPCTTGDSCQAGVCVPTVNNCGCTTNGDCHALDQCHDDGTCGGDFKCTYPVKTNGTGCDDGNPCTQTDTCQSGVCTGANPKTCGAPDQCHEAGSCDPGNGTCVYPSKTDGTACSDGDLCTQVDTCQGGVCVGSQPKICANDECRFGGNCVPATGQCDGVPKPDDTPCNDGNPCTQNDKCTAGACAGAAVTCTALDSCHNVGTCSSTTGLCTNPPKLNGADCDDGNACTSGEKCTNGVCGNATSVVTCAPTDACHAEGVCDPATGQCSNPIRPNGTPCNDEKECTTGDTCQAGACTPAASDCTCNVTGDCPAVNQCQMAVVCNSSHKCEYVLKTDGTPCDDGDACTTGETCTDGVCGTPTSTVTCTALDQCHGVGACDPATGKCTNPIKADGTSCNDQVTCTTGDACQAGVCVFAVNDCTCVDDGDCPAPTPCLEQGTCSPTTHKCSYSAKSDGTPCDDGNACTSGESCQGGMCEAPTQVVTCAPLDACHEAGVCDVATGRCSDPLKADDTTCDDGDECTTGETCQGGLCMGGTPSCEDGGVDGGQDAGVPEDGGADGGGHVDGSPEDASGQQDAATGDGAAKQESKSYLSCNLAAAGNGAAAGPLALLLTALGAALGRRRRR
jgi:hypothetical protein